MEPEIVKRAGMEPRTRRQEGLGRFVCNSPAIAQYSRREGRSYRKVVAYIFQTIRRWERKTFECFFCFCCDLFLWYSFKRAKDKWIKRGKLRANQQYGMTWWVRYFKVYCSQRSAKCKENLGRKSPKYFMFWYSELHEKFYIHRELTLQHFSIWWITNVVMQTT